MRAFEEVSFRGLQEFVGVREIGLGMGAGAVEGGKGLIEHRNDPLLLFQRRQ